MAHVSLRVSDEEKSWMEAYAKTHRVNLSEAIKAAFFEKLEDEYDLKIIEEYENEKKKGRVEFYSFDEVKEALGYNDEL